MSILGGNCSPCCGATPPCAARDYTPVSSDAVDATGWAAQQFLVGSTSITLTSVSLSIAGYTPIYGSPGSPGYNAPVCRLRENVYTYNGGNDYWTPGSVLATLTGPTDIFDANWEFTHAGYSLSAATRYWISLEQNGYWNFYDIGDCGASPGQSAECCGKPWSFTANSGGSWDQWYLSGTYAATPYLLLVNGQDLS